MKISNLRIKGFKSFGINEGVNIPLNNNLAAFIGLNSAGKTTALEALRRLFGSSNAEREINRQDFHVGKNENPDEIEERELSIEVKINFSDNEQEAVPHFFSNMVVDDQGEEPYIRIRLEATWKKSEILPQGEVEVKTYFIKVAENEAEDDGSKQIFPNHFRSLIQVLYVPAIRRPAEQLKYASGSILYRVLRKIKWGDEFKEDFDKKINDINKLVEKNITKFDDSERGLLSQNILSNLRNLIELIFLRIYNQKQNQSLKPQYENYRIAEKYVKQIGKLRFIGKFHDLLQISVSHYTPDENASERLMLKYYEYLLRIKTFMKDNYGIELLENLHKFPLNTDTAFTQYYEAIEKVLENKAVIARKTIQHGRFYIEKLHPVIVNDVIFYEVTFIPAHDKSSKFDRIIAFTKQEISSYYAVELHLAEFDIQVLECRMPIVVIVDWSVSIRACEFRNFAKIFGLSQEYGELKEYSNLRNIEELRQKFTYNIFNALYSTTKKKNTF